MATRIVGFCISQSDSSGSAIALLIGRPDVAIDEILPTALGLAIILLTLRFAFGADRRLTGG